MKKSNLKKTIAKNPTKTFTLKVWRAESYRKGLSALGDERAAFYTFTNSPDAQAVADFKRLLGEVPQFQRLNGNPLVDCERAIKARRLADACYELHAQKLIPRSVERVS